MRLNTAQDIIGVAEDRGFCVFVDPGPPPMPYLRGPKEHATEALMQALRAWRLEIIEIADQEKMRVNDPVNDPANERSQS